MRIVPQGFSDRVNARTNKPIYLYIIEDGPISPAILRYAQYPTSIVFDGETYLAAPLQSEDVTENIAQEIDQTTVTVGAVDKVIVALLENYDGLRGCKFTRRLVDADNLGDPTAFTDDIFWVSSVVLKSTAAAFTLKSKMDLMNLELPLRRFYRGTCQFKFKDLQTCRYSGSATTCPHTISGCQTLFQDMGLDFIRFGGFPGTGSAIRRIYV
jgi:lambda family phage minor tail protein L